MIVSEEGCITDGSGYEYKFGSGPYSSGTYSYISGSGALITYINSSLTRPARTSITYVKNKILDRHMPTKKKNILKKALKGAALVGGALL